MKRATVSAMAAFTLLLAAPAGAGEAGMQETAQEFLPNSGPRGERQVAVGQTIVRLPVHWQAAARLLDPAVLDIEGHKATFPADALMPQVLFRESGLSNRPRRLYCTRSNNDRRFFDFGWGSSLDDKLFKGLPAMQICLEDADGDGRFDRSLRINFKKFNFQEAVLAMPVRYQPLSRAPIAPDQDYVELSLREVSAARLVVHLDVVRRGHRRPFKTFTTGMEFGDADTRIYWSGAPIKRQKILGIEFDIAAVDAQRSLVTFSFPADAPADKVVAVPLDIRKDPY